MSKHEHAKPRKHEADRNRAFSWVRGFVVSWFCLAIGAAVLVAQQADRARTEALARRASERLQSLQREADRLASEERTILTELQKLELDRQLKAAELNQIDQDLKAVQTELQRSNARLEELRRAEAVEGPELRARIVEFYKLGKARYARLLLSAPDLRRV